MDGHEKASAGETAKARSYVGGDDVTRHQHGSANSTGTQAQSDAERLFKLFAGNEHRHVKGYGPPAWNEEKQKWELKVTTIHKPVTLKDWNTRLYPTSQYILSVIPL